MRTLKNLSLILLTVVLTNFLSSAAIFGEESYNKNNASKKPSGERKSSQFVHTTLLNGKMIPSVNLPVVTIRADRSTKNIAGVIKRGNSFIAVVDLPEIVITSEKKTSGYRLRTIAGKNGNLPEVDLPAVVINAKRMNVKSYAWIETNENKIPVVNLPEVTISADFPKYNRISTVLYNGHFIPAVNLPEVEILAGKNERMIASNSEDSSDSNNDELCGYLPLVEAKTEKRISSVVLILAKAIFLK